MSLTNTIVTTDIDTKISICETELKRLKYEKSRQDVFSITKELENDNYYRLDIGPESYYFHNIPGTVLSILCQNGLNDIYYLTIKNGLYIKYVGDSSIEGYFKNCRLDISRSIEVLSLKITKITKEQFNYVVKCIVDKPEILKLFDIKTPFEQGYN